MLLTELPASHRGFPCITSRGSRNYPFGMNITTALEMGEILLHGRRCLGSVVSRPAAAQRLVQGNLAAQLSQTVLHQLLLGTEQQALSIQYVQIAVHTFLIALVGQTIILGGVSNQIALGLKLLAVGAACRQAVRHLFERNLYGLFVLRDAYVFLDFSIIQIGAQAACMENGQRNLRQEAPCAQSALHKT